MSLTKFPMAIAKEKKLRDQGFKASGSGGGKEQKYYIIRTRLKEERSPCPTLRIMVPPPDAFHYLVSFPTCKIILMIIVNIHASPT